MEKSILKEEIVDEVIIMNNKIGVFDSGIGGLSILNELKTMLPHENFL